MQEEKLEKLLNELTERTVEKAGAGLAEDIKRRIPQKLVPHRGRMDTINIIIDLRVSKLAAAAVIIITMILWVNFFGRRHSAGDGIYQDSKLLVKYCFGGAGAGKEDVLAGMSKFHEYLVQEGVDVVYYGACVDMEDSNSVLIHWKLSGGNYRVVFGDLRAKTISGDKLIELQAKMLQNKTTK